MDSVTLRQSHFKLGDDQNKYITSSMEQSDGIENHKQSSAALDQKAKNELRKSLHIKKHKQNIRKLNDDNRQDIINNTEEKELIKK